MYDSNQVDAFRYAQMQSSINNKTGGSKASNPTRFNLVSKFSSLEVSLNSIEGDLRVLCTDTQESLRYAKQVINDVVGRQMNQEKAKLNQEIKKLDKFVQYGISESQKRSQKINSDCRERMNCSESLKNSMNKLRIRVNKLESTLGFEAITETIL